MYPRFSSPRGFAPPFPNRGPSPGQHRFNGPPPQHGPTQRFHQPPPSPDYRGPRPSHPLSPTYDRGPPAFPPGEQHASSPGFPPPGPPNRGHYRGHPGPGYSPRGPGPQGNHAPPPGPGRGGFVPERGGRGGPRFSRGGGYRGGHRGGGAHHGGHQTGGGQGFHPRQGGDGHGQGFKRHNRPDNGPVPQKKQKIDKRDTPEYNLYVCETCDRGFNTEEKFKEHNDQHTKCSVEGCNYIAAPKLVKLHYQWQHLTGFAKKIWNVTESPEDIEKWRQERRSNFPTAANKAKKAAIQEEKIQRGEVLETKFFGKTRGRGRGQGRGRGRGRGRRRNWDEPQEESAIPIPDKEVKDKTDKGKDKDKTKEDASKGVQAESERTSIPNGQDPLSLLIADTKEDGELDDDTQTSKTETVQTLPGGLGTLLCSYADMSDSDKEDDSKPKEQSSKPASTASTEEKTEAVLMTDMDTHMPPPRDAASHTSDQGGRGGRRARKRDRGKNKNKNQNNKPVRRAPSLLEKLLAPEIRHERNVLLQCVRYIVRNNFFGIGAENGTASKEETDTKPKDVEDLPITTPKVEAAAP